MALLTKNRDPLRDRRSLEFTTDDGSILREKKQTDSGLATFIFVRTKRPQLTKGGRPL